MIRESKGSSHATKPDLISPVLESSNSSNIEELVAAILVIRKQRSPFVFKRHVLTHFKKSQEQPVV